MHVPVATILGYCASCDTERPLIVVEHGPRGLRGWLAGIGPEDRTLSHTCRLCGRVEHVPLTEAEDAEYDLTLLRWPDTFLPALHLVPAPLPAVVAPRLVVLPQPRKPVVHVLTLPVEQVLATDDRLLALSVA